MSPITHLAVATALASLAQASPRLIFHVILDDLGWSDVTWHRPTNLTIENSTPNMAALVAEGVQLDRHYVYSTCTPSRSSFLSGRLPVHVQTTLSNPEQPNSGIPRNMTTLAKKLKAQGFTTAVVGKWDVGMATPDHTPEGRGFDSSLIYYEHKVDFWTQELLDSVCQSYDDGKIVDLWSDGGPARGLNGTAYLEYLFRDRVLQILNSHDVQKDGPLYLQYNPHVAHCPLQVPPGWLSRYTFGDDESACKASTYYIFPGSTVADYRCRNQYEAMVALADEIIGNITAVIKGKGWWNDTLMVLHADNGAPLVPGVSGGNNAPLRGGKYVDWEGGVRAAAFVSGGYLPASVRGTVQSAPMHVADWYATYCILAGGSPEFCTSDPLAEGSGLPPVDSLDLWPLISGANATSPRHQFPLSSQALIQGRWKYINGSIAYATWTGWTYPNASSTNGTLPVDVVLDCGGKGGCLFNVIADPTEHNDVAAENPALLLV